MSVRKLLFKSSLLIAMLFFAVGCSDLHQKRVLYEVSSTTSVNKPKPTNENIHKWTMMPYAELGKGYTPKIVPVGKKYYGVSSWYGPDFHGKKTSNGEVYDMYGFTAAHKTLPMNTVIVVTNKETDQNVTVRVNDRGPFVDERIVDLSFSAGKQIGLDKTGIAQVELEVLAYDEFITESLAKSQKINAVKEKDFYVQIGSFKNEEGAQKVKNGAAFIYENREIKIKSVNGEKNPIYRVYISGFKNEAEAKEFIQKNEIDGAFIVADN